VTSLVVGWLVGWLSRACTYCFRDIRSQNLGFWRSLALRNALYKFKTYLLTYLPGVPPKGRKPVRDPGLSTIIGNFTPIGYTSAEISVPVRKRELQQI